MQRADPSFAIRVHIFNYWTKAQVNAFKSVYQLQASILTNYLLPAVGQPAKGHCFHTNCVYKRSSNNRIWKKKVSHSHTKKDYLWKSGNLITQALMIGIEQSSSSCTSPHQQGLVSSGQLQQLTPAVRAGTSVPCASIVFSYCHRLFISH